MTADMPVHIAALACSLLAACCAASGPIRQRRERGVVSLLMTVAMLDAAVLHVIAPIVWASVLVAAALVLSATRRVREGRTGGGVFSAAGLVVMAALLATGAHGASPTVALSHHGAGAGAPVLQGLGVVLAVGHVAASAHRMRRGSSTERIHHTAMGGSTALMAVAVLL
ncbi:hypothetical protein [Microbacterium hydrothermale]|uniref:hypothetical protein n=1 Tax=Microbacterium hydrothermale TaxID=857427 RepID=UPI0010A87340|nr:hypothetical protein [Microbacterium hydrothermale]